MKKRIKDELNENFDSLDKLMDETPKERLHFVDRANEVAAQIWSLLETKGWKQKELASAMGKSESEVSKILSGTHNLTLRTIAHIETVLGESVIYTKVGREEENIRLGRKEYNWHSMINRNPLVSQGWQIDSNSEPEAYSSVSSNNSRNTKPTGIAA